MENLFAVQTNIATTYVDEIIVIRWTRSCQNNENSSNDISDSVYADHTSPYLLL